MSRPDPADIVGTLGWIVEHVATIETRLLAIETESEARRLNAAEAARALGFSEGYFHGKPWRIPEYGAHGFLHPLASWRTWLERPEGARRSAWEAMSATERSRIRRTA